MKSESFRSWAEVTAVFGGSFDPPHEGHRLAVLGVFRNPGVRRVLVVPSASPPHKPCAASAEDRVEMARRAFLGNGTGEEIQIDPRELDRARNQPGLPSYTFDTLSELKREHSQLCFVLGADQLTKLHTWHRFPDLLDLSHWIVLERKPEGRGMALATLRQWASSGLVQSVSDTEWNTRSGNSLLVVSTDAPFLSSTEIREAIARTGEPPEGKLPSGVLAYLKAHSIYGTRGTDSL